MRNRIPTADIIERTSNLSFPFATPKAQAELGERVAQPSQRKSRGAVGTLLAWLLRTGHRRSHVAHLWPQAIATM
jgi:hypothetical protein